VVTEAARRKYRQRDVWTVPARRGDQVVAERKLGHVELGGRESACEQAFELAGSPVDVEAFDAHAPVEQRLGAVESADRRGDARQAG
jgi:hypothetical protein